MQASPHTRGWTLCRRNQRRGDHGFPAHAGMDPLVLYASGRRFGLPRTRGDGPEIEIEAEAYGQASPHTRGWTSRHVLLASYVRGFPAHAGMDLVRISSSLQRSGLPRTRGDGPVREYHDLKEMWASPHTRGWTRYQVLRRTRGGGFPAHAGMDRASGREAAPASRLPRTRGDGPHYAAPLRLARQASPHTRGWTLMVGFDAPQAAGFPAHAGMDPAHGRPRSRSRGLPRTRGDGPDTVISRPG